LVAISKPTMFAQRTTFAYQVGDIPILDGTPNAYLAGAQALTGDGGIAGIVYIRFGRIYLITADVIDAFLKNYLSIPS